ncbi:bifunctional glycosyltransferase/CDP-glycerol:glycerophosphate glycerophosphotransferase [Lactiplantibacillus modestisalitolerans]|uniref:CDP-glycerol glycerophosphotransferase family protein n=1 Tax=Lactiplantibacillus modestisalitolerans TaxID=1457219 RepID=A0ABV5WSD8_9LACO|nr:bifunctional glycosyltransferase/CDP-glycerol:glycerophosphate glycerophosphotransferase [Lactiplantibacillus modestisalitolerans]
MTNKLLTIVVTCYNIQNEIAECLDSIVGTNFPKEQLDVLIIDDHSTDHTVTILDDYVAHYDYMRVLHKPDNEGISAARNSGIKMALGRYLAFVDGDDLVTVNAYSKLVYLAQSNNSDVVMGFVRRFDSLRDRGSYLHKFAITGNYTNTTLDAHPEFLYDTTVWNKVYRLSFLRDNQLNFINNIIYEDIPFTTAVHLASRKTTVTTSVVYKWRWRESGNSITQSRDALNNYHSRLNALNTIHQYLLDAGYSDNSALMEALRVKILKLDIPIYIENIADANEDYIYKLQELTFQFLTDPKWHLLEEKYLKSLPLKTQVQYWAIMQGNFELLKKYSYQKNFGQFKRQHGHYTFSAPGVPHSVLKKLYFKDNVLPVRQKLTGLKFHQDTETVTGSGMFRISTVPLKKKIGSSANKDETLTATLINLANQKQIPITFHRVTTPTYKRLLKSRSSWTNARYTFSFNVAEALAQLGSGDWNIQITDDLAHTYQVTSYLGAPKKASKQKISHLEGQDYILKTNYDPSWNLTFNVNDLAEETDQAELFLANPRLEQNNLIFDTNMSSSEKAIIQINQLGSIAGVLDTASQNIRFPIQTLTSSELNLSPEPLNHLDRVLNGFPQNLFGHFMKVVILDAATNSSIDYQRGETNIVNTLTAGNSRLVVSSTGVSTYWITKDYPAVKLALPESSVTDGNLRIQLTSENTNLMNWLSTPLDKSKLELISTNKEHRYSFTFAKLGLTQLDNQSLLVKIPLLNAQQLQILSGTYQFKFYVFQPEKSDAEIFVGEAAAAFTPENQLSTKLSSLAISTGNANIYWKVNSNNYPELRITQPFSGFFNRSKGRRAISYSVMYPLMRWLPLRKTMMFDAYWASKFDSNEKSMYEYLDKQHPEVKAIWTFTNDQTPITGNGIAVRKNTLKYWYYLATSKYLIQNTNLPNQYLKRRGQIEVETLHGTFLKYMGFDEPYFRTASARIQNNFARRIRRWDYMIVPSKYMAETASSAFDYHQKLLPTNFPRNDALIRYRQDTKYQTQLKKRLNIPIDKKVILYAPTYRGTGAFDFQLDIERLRATLSDEYVLLIRLHYLVANTNSFSAYGSFVYDMSDYPDINDLYLVSDVLITDYSSVMFDYALLQRPMIFYAYDKDWYLDPKNRGVYLDYEREMPGPICTTTDNLISCLQNYADLNTKYAAKIDTFNAKFNDYATQHGDASATTIEQILSTKAADLDQIPDKGVIWKKFWHLFMIRDFQSRFLNYLGRKLPKRNIIMFESFFGHQYSDNPKAIYEYIKAHYPKYKLYWNVNKDNVAFFKEHHIPYITRFGYRGIFKQAQAKYWITNVRRPFRWKVPQGTTLLQTWHGTPLKTIGTDVNLVTMPGNNVVKYHRQIVKDSRRWDYLLAPNQYSADIMVRAFRKNANQMMLTGYPRNDILVNYTPELVQRIKSNLEIENYRHVVLYAPTWRDNEYVKDSEFTAKLHLDLDLLQQKFGNDTVFLIRTHYMIANSLDLSGYDNVLNVSDYGDINELYLISDVLITDYSSVMFDYAVLKRPMIFFTYDLDDYANEIRGFYFDFQSQVPGDIVKTNAEVVTALANIFNGDWHPNEKYQRFVDTYCQWMDGQATKRVVEGLFNTDLTYHYFAPTELKLPETSTIKPGASMWKQNKDFRNRHDVSFMGNYDPTQNQQQPTGMFKIEQIMQLESLGTHALLGMKYAKVSSIKNTNAPTIWVALDDLNIISI